MAATLHSRAGDSQALKACISAALSGTALDFKRASCLKDVPVSLGISCKRALVMASGAQITDANTMAELLGWRAHLRAGFPWGLQMFCVWGQSVQLCCYAMRGFKRVVSELTQGLCTRNGLVTNMYLIVNGVLLVR